MIADTKDYLFEENFLSTKVNQILKMELEIKERILDLNFLVFF